MIWSGLGFSLGCFVFGRLVLRLSLSLCCAYLFCISRFSFVLRSLGGVCWLRVAAGFAFTLGLVVG